MSWPHYFDYTMILQRVLKNMNPADNEETDIYNAIEDKKAFINLMPKTYK